MTATPVTNPFPGLRPFREEEDYLFFGRESQVDAMVDKLAADALPRGRWHVGLRESLRWSTAGCARLFIVA